MSLSSSPRRSHILNLLLSLAFFLNATVFIWVIASTIYPPSTLRPTAKYSYVADDYPKNFPIDLHDVFLATEESIHYQLYGEQALDEWFMQVPRNNGAVRLGENHRALVVTTGHELHCLWRMAWATGDPSHRLSGLGHSHHCLDYIRRRILCDADLTLEPFDPLERDFAKERTGAVHVCKDWTKLLGTMDDNFEEWMDFHMSSLQ